MESPPNTNQTSLPPPAPSPMSKLTQKQVKFVVCFARHGIGARAAREAGYSENNARQEAHKQLNNPSVRVAIDAYMEEHAMTAGEAIGRMSNWARGNLQSFLNENGEIDLQSDEAQENLGQVKKYKRRKTIVRGANDFESETVSEEIELYDAKDATDKMIQIYGRYKQVPGDAGLPKQRLLIDLGDGISFSLNG